MKKFFIPIAAALVALPSFGEATTYACERGVNEKQSFNITNTVTSEKNRMCSAVKGSSENSIEWTSNFEIVEIDPYHQPSTGVAQYKFESLPLQDVSQVPVSFTYNFFNTSAISSAVIMTMNTRRGAGGSASFNHLVVLASYNGARTVTSSMEKVTAVVVDDNLFDVYKSKDDDVTTFTYLSSKPLDHFCGNFMDFFKCLPEGSTSFPLYLQSMSFGVEVYSGKDYFDATKLEVKIEKH
ncbi:uncharacterized protein CCR75_006186 [Bremia lactucae]|uniref:Uncharacterized protein n=1 Tax=Bremia lactucae TaxID=4779 RepID=A0A976FGW0_BRELC|nr:hypothetical protein CCR75_006186 [Bremia lactucae]